MAIPNLALLIAIGSACQRAPHEAFAAPAEFRYEVDFARAARVGWAPYDVAEQEAGAVLARAIEQRVRLRLDLGVTAELATSGDLVVRPRRQLREDERRKLNRLLLLTGTFELLFMAQPSDLDPRVGIVRERARLTKWLAANPRAPVASFAFVDRDEGGPDPRLAWVPIRSGKGGPSREDPLLLVRPTSHEDAFDAYDLASAWSSADTRGLPAIAVELLAEREDDFARFTRANVGRQLAIVIGGRVASAPTLNDALGRSFLIQGEFSTEEVHAIVAGMNGLEQGGFLRLVER
jgi:hypothetical protein